jgi:hypothetical protein
MGVHHTHADEILVKVPRGPRQPGDEGIADFRPAAAVDAQLPDTHAGKPRIKS